MHRCASLTVLRHLPNGAKTFRCRQRSAVALSLLLNSVWNGTCRQFVYFFSSGFLSRAYCVRHLRSVHETWVVSTSGNEEERGRTRRRGRRRRRSRSRSKERVAEGYGRLQDIRTGHSDDDGQKLHKGGQRVPGKKLTLREASEDISQIARPSEYL